ncbi:MAG: hypothetical protein HQ517_11810 [SAR324 cluster bacterium]|nr:hypothetical protein [SAR324 cluster bacterium]
MKHYALLIFGFGILTTFSGCIYLDIEQPGRVKTNTIFQLNSNDFEVLDRVTVTGETTLWFGAVLSGGKGYQSLLAEAKKMGGDEIMNYSFDVQTTSVLFFIYSNVQWKATGFAVKFKNSVRQ